jgi:hypothetical protein
MQNSIRIGQTFISRKSNAGKSSKGTGTIKVIVLHTWYIGVRKC